MKEEKIIFNVSKESKKQIEAKAKVNGQKTGTFTRNIVERYIQTDLILTNKAFEYVGLVDAIDNISDDEERLEVRRRLEAFVCL